MSDWYYSQNETVFGPFDLPSLKQMLQAGAITSDTLVAQQGSEQWKPLSEVSFSAAKQTKKWPPLFTTLGCAMAAFYPVWMIFIGSALIDTIGLKAYFSVLSQIVAFSVAFCVFGWMEFRKNRSDYSGSKAVWAGIIVSALLFVSHTILMLFA